MAERGGLLGKFAKALDVENAVRIRLTKITPKADVLDADDTDKIKPSDYFTPTQIEIPYHGIITEAIPLTASYDERLRHRLSLPQDMFPHVPKELDVQREAGFSKNNECVPLTLVTMPNGDKFYVTQSMRDIDKLAEVDRAVKAKAATDLVAAQLRSELGL